MRKCILFCFFLAGIGCFQSTVQGQDTAYARAWIDTLCAPSLFGRGYVNAGDRKAATLIANEFNRLKLKPFNKTFFQLFPNPVNTFPGKMEVTINGKKLVPGLDYLVYPFSSGDKGTFSLHTLNAETVQNNKAWTKFQESEVKNNYVLVDGKDASGDEMKEMFSVMPYNPPDARGVVIIEDGKLTHSVAQGATEHVAIKVLRSSLPEQEITSLSLDIKQKALSKNHSQNVIGYIKGYEKPDSFVVFTAHYDHLGMMGNSTCFPGANDNASGTAMLLDFARHYAQNPPRYSVAFMAFGGEEVGLIGSRFYTEHPFFPLDKIKFLINIDLMGNGSKGITVVNGRVFQEDYNAMVAINEKNNYLPEVKSRGKAQNSDHYYFSEQGVPAFFIYSRGEFNAYHDIYDVPKDLPLERYEDLFRLILDFAKYVQ